MCMVGKPQEADMIQFFFTRNANIFKGTTPLLIFQENDSMWLNLLLYPMDGVPSSAVFPAVAQ